MKWTKLSTGNIGAFGEDGWFYSVGRAANGRGWYTESWHQDSPQRCYHDRSARQGDAKAEAASREKLVTGLGRTYGVDAATAQSVAATARRDGFTHVVQEGWRLRAGYGQGSYQLAVLAHEVGGVAQYPYTTDDGQIRWACCDSAIGSPCKHLVQGG